MGTGKSNFGFDGFMVPAELQNKYADQDSDMQIHTRPSGSLRF